MIPFLLVAIFREQSVTDVDARFYTGIFYTCYHYYRCVLWEPGPFNYGNINDVCAHWCDYQ